MWLKSDYSIFDTGEVSSMELAEDLRSVLVYFKGGARAPLRVPVTASSYRELVVAVTGYHANSLREIPGEE